MALDRFISAQDRIWPAPVQELRRGRKTTHWMWFVFPQLRGLGRSQTAQFYGITDLEEARAFLAHPVLGSRLQEAAAAALSHRDESAETIFGHIDAMKLRSCATLFEAAGEKNVMPQVLAVFFAGRQCPRSVEILTDG